MEKVYSYRFYPTPEQESLLRKTFGCVRLVYNRAVAARTDAWDEPQERVGYVQPSAMLTEWKKQDDFQFLNEVSSEDSGICKPPSPTALRDERHTHSSTRSATAAVWPWDTRYPPVEGSPWRRGALT